MVKRPKKTIRILLTFNEYVKAGEGKANFNGEEVELTFKGKTASYAYTALDYNQVCQFSSPKVQS